MAQGPDAKNNNMQAREENFTPRIIVQGGGYSSMQASDLQDLYKAVTKESCRKGYIKMMNGGTAVDAVETAIRVLEESEYFSAGRGSLLNTKGQVECDAMIMDGNTLNYGAVTTGRHFLYPVSVARAIMDDKTLTHCILNGEGALEFAQQKHLSDVCGPRDLITDFAQKRVQATYHQCSEYVKYEYNGEPLMESTSDKEAYDTISAVAMDDKGHFACATSSGGLPGKFVGRIGDASLIGCGGYANNKGAAATTGNGEIIMKMTLAREVIHNIENQMGAQDSAETALNNMKERLNGHGGIIAIDETGEFGIAFNTKVMVWASMRNKNTITCAMKEGETPEEVPANTDLE